VTDPVLAYVFWHAPSPTVAPAEYEAELARFHGSLAASPPPGFVRSASYRLGRLPWEPSAFGPVVYADWYLVADFGALGHLNHDAVALPHHGSHDAVAALAEHGVGGLYRLRRGTVDLDAIRFDGWIAKPRGVPSEVFAAQVLPDGSPPEASLWQRQMALGPAPEYCRRTKGPVAVLAEGERRIEVRPVALQRPG
jgi:hypothetical protein